MGGRGSGRQSSLGLMVSKTCESHSIDLAWLRRRKLFNVGHGLTLRWSRGGTETGSIHLECLPSAVRLVYRTRSQDAEWRDISELVPLVETETRFGGRRQWFLCLSCNRRCRILYGGSHFHCRRCNGLKYDTQYEPPFARAATRALKIREKLGGKGGIDDPFPDKPKGMHWETYDRLVEQEAAFQNVWAVGIMAKFDLGETERD